MKQRDMFDGWAELERTPRHVRLGGDLSDSVREEDVGFLNHGCRVVLEILSDHEWHTGPEITRAAAVQDALRRLRELRQFGYEIERERISGERMTWRYRWNGIITRPGGR